ATFWNNLAVTALLSVFLVPAFYTRHTVLQQALSIGVGLAAASGLRMISHWWLTRSHTSDPSSSRGWSEWRHSWLWRAGWCLHSRPTATHECQRAALEWPSTTQSSRYVGTLQIRVGKRVGGPAKPRRVVPLDDDIKQAGSRPTSQCRRE